MCCWLNRSRNRLSQPARTRSNSSAAIQRLTGLDDAELVDYQIRAVTGGRDAQGEVTVTIRHGGKPVRGRAWSTDIIEASVRAYLNAINRVLFRCELGENNRPTQL